MRGVNGSAKFLASVGQSDLQPFVEVEVDGSNHELNACDRASSDRRLNMRVSDMEGRRKVQSNL